jgi:carboxypeptidase Q
LDAGETVTGVADVYSDIRNVTTYNVIAETKCGDHDNVLVLGAHADSVFDGPGINDDGSGTIGILTTSIELSKYRTNNAVRFCWWAGEEFGLLGSTHYVETLNETASEIEKIKLYLNFDMIASPNFVYATFDGDGSEFNLTGPPGSAEVEQFYERWFDSNRLNHTATAFDGRSDYQAFADNGIPCGGLFTGAGKLSPYNHNLRDRHVTRCKYNR